MRHRVVWVALVGMTLAACTAGEPLDEPSILPPPTTESPSSPPPADWPEVFDARSAVDVFALVELGEGRRGVMYASSHEDPVPLPGDVRAASPDGSGGVVYVTDTQVWWLRTPDSEPLLLEDPGTRVDLIGLRAIEQEPSVLVQIGDKVIGYDTGSSHLLGLFDYGGGVRFTLDEVDRDRGVGVAVDLDRGAWGEVVHLATGERTQLTEAAVEVDNEAVKAVAIDGDRIVVLRRQASTVVLDIDGTEVGSLDLGISSRDVFSVDLVDGRLLVAFGESATVTDIVTGEREVVDLQGYRVLGAVWTDVADPWSTPIVRDRPRFAVDTAAVEADVDDPHLNVRTAPDPGAPVVAKLPSTYTGVLWLGAETLSDDGGRWYHVALQDPVAVRQLEEPFDGTVRGWVNAAFLVELSDGLPVDTAEISACERSFPSIEQVPGSNPAGHVYALESAFLSSRCLRVVLTFGPGEAPLTLVDVPDDLAPSDGIPGVAEWMSGGSGVIVDLGGITSAWPGATDTEHGVYLVRSQGMLQLWSPNPASTTVWGLNDRGIVVVDLLIDDDLAVPPTGPFVSLTRHPRTGSGTVEVTGIARPFEASLGVRIEDAAGESVEAIYSGSLAFGTVRSESYSVQTEDWLEAWAPFAVQAQGLEPGDYTMVLDGEGGVDQPRTMRIPFTIDEPSPAPTLATAEELDTIRSLVDLARGHGTVADVPFASEVTIGLGLAETKTLSRSELADPDAWIAESEDFEGFVGPFSILDTLSRSHFNRISSGPIPHCAGPAYDWPDEFDGLRQVNIEPIGIDSCINWFAVSLFLDDSGEIEAVVLDLFGP